MGTDLSSPFSDETKDLRKLDYSTYNAWMTTAQELKSAGESESRIYYAAARAYTQEDGFYPYCHDVLGLTDMYEPFHSQLCDFAMDNEATRTLLLAFRGSFKTCITTEGYIAWRIGKEYIETGKCNTRYMVASERKAISVPMVANILGILERNENWIRLFGDHKGSKGGDRKWTDSEFFSRFRTDTKLREPTVSAIAIDAPRTGWHVDEIHGDDLQGESFSLNRQQIDRVWRFYQLLHNIVEPRGAKIPGKLKLKGTRWHFDDIYSKIMKREAAGSKKKFYKTLILPAEMDGRLLSRFAC